MAQKKAILFKLLSSAGTGYYYIGRKQPRNAINKLSLRKYDPMVQRHVVFNETKLSTSTRQSKKSK